MRVGQILDAALQEFSAAGYAGARMDDIAARAGLSKGGLYAHFASKEEVFEALLARYLSPPRLDARALVEGSATPRHLAERDVYKRQGGVHVQLDLGRLAGQHVALEVRRDVDGEGIAPGVHAGVGLGRGDHLGPVSYTHLDVYKRQEHHRGHRPDDGADDEAVARVVHLSLIHI